MKKKEVEKRLMDLEKQKNEIAFLHGLKSKHINKRNRNKRMKDESKQVKDHKHYLNGRDEDD